MPRIDSQEGSATAISCGFMPLWFLMHRARIFCVYAAAVLVALMALLVILGYALHQQALLTVLPSGQAMSIFTALALLCASGALLGEIAQRFTVVNIVASVSGLVGVVFSILHISARGDPLSPYVEHWLFGIDVAKSGQMSAATAASVAGLSAAFLWREKPWLADNLTALVLVIGGIALLGYAYGVDDFYAMYVFRTMAIHTATAIFLLALGLLIARPSNGIAEVVFSAGGGGRATRRLLAFMLLPAVVGLILLHAISAGRIGLPTAMAILVASTIVPLGVVILVNGHALNSLEEERRCRAAQLAASADHLTEQLAAQAEALRRESADREQAEQQLARAQRMEAIGRLTGGIAHDFNNLLMAISGNLQLLLRRLPSENPGRRFASNALAAIERGSKLTSQLLSFSRIQKLDIQPILLDAVVAGACDLLGPTLGPAISVTIRLTARTGWAWVDTPQLELAILNLALNARDAMPGGGELIIESGECVSRAFPGKEEQAHLFVRVQDNGMGMTPEVLARVGEPFFTTKERGKGSGLGLAQVYGFVRQCGGEVNITSTVGLGTRVELLLRCAPAPPDRSAPPPREEALPVDLPHRDQLLLVIDDDDAVRSVLVQSLRDAGFVVIEASNGAAGLELLEHHSPVAAIIDFIMPGLNGADVARRAQSRQPGLPIIFVSGYYDTLALDEIAGAVVLRKPIDFVQLTRTISSVVA